MLRVKSVAPYSNGDESHVQSDSSDNPRQKLTKLEVAGALYNLFLWVFIAFLVVSQMLTPIWQAGTVSTKVNSGSDVSLGPQQIVDTVNAPYTDRSVVCIKEGCSFHAIQVNDALEDTRTKVFDTTGEYIGGYRMMNRSGMTLSPIAQNFYDSTCTVINETIDGIIGSCEALGYTKLNRTGVKIIRGTENSVTNLIPHVLPIVMIPITDNLESAKYVIPGEDGHSCMFRLSGLYTATSDEKAILYGVSRDDRDHKTQEFLGRYGGEWRNGWYHDKQGMKWYSDVISSKPNSSVGAFRRQFDTIRNKELEVVDGWDQWELQRVLRTWSKSLQMLIQVVQAEEVLIANGYRYGFSNLKFVMLNTTLSVYDIYMFISSLSIIWLLTRWMVLMVALYNGYRKGHTRWHNAKIGGIACSFGINFIPFTMIPRLPQIAASFWTIGCRFQGNQSVLADAWFVMYPSIVDFVLLTFSFINITGRLIRRRVSDAFVGPAIYLLSLLHLLRNEIQFLEGFGLASGVPNMVSSDEVDNMTILQSLSYDMTMRLNGRVLGIFVLKIGIITLCVSSLLFSEKIIKRVPPDASMPPSRAEASLALNAYNIGGLGRSSLYNEMVRTSESQVKTYQLSAYELGRMNYVVFGDQFLLTWSDWSIITAIRPLKLFYRYWNHRVTVYQVEMKDGVYFISRNPALKRLDDPKLLAIPWWKIDLRSLG